MAPGLAQLSAADISRASAFQLAAEGSCGARQGVENRI
jgi:hypothetical protein